MKHSDVILELGPFTFDQARSYLARKGITAEVPHWLPRSPLLLGYLATRDLLQEAGAIPITEDPAAAWDFFITRIAERDAEIARDIDPKTVRRLLERLSTVTRLSVNGNREIDDADVNNAFLEVTGVSAADTTHVLLQRLPGLTSRNSQEGLRSFVDNQMLEALRASDEATVLNDPYTALSDQHIQYPLSAFGCEMLAFLGEKMSVPIKKHVVAARESMHRWRQGTVALDLLLGAAIRAQPESVDCEDLTVTDGYVDVLDIEEERFSRLALEGCVITTLRLGTASPADIVLERCLVGTVEGATSPQGMPDWIRNYDVLAFEDGATTSALLDLEVPLSVRVCLTILKKVFVQRGRGRMDGALRRGLDARAQQYVAAVLKLLQKHEFVWSSQHGGNVVWHANAALRARVMRMLAGPMASADPVIFEAMQEEA